MNMLNILLIGQFAPGNLELIYFNAFRQLKKENIFLYDIRSDSKIMHTHSSLKRIIQNRFTYNLLSRLVFNGVNNFLEQKKNFYDVVIIFKGMEFSLDNLSTLKEKQQKAIWININPDNPFNTESIASTNQNVIDSIKFFDIYCIWSKRLVEKLSENDAKKVIYLPFAFDSTYHHPPTKHVQIIKDQVIFVGAWDKEREDVLNSLSNFNLLVFGNGWDRISKNSLKQKRIFPYNIYLDDLSEAVYSSAVSLNILRRQNKDSHNMRTFEIPAMNGLMLTTRTEEQNLFFPEGEACLMYDDIIELKEKIFQIINNPAEAKKIRQNGFKAAKNHTYINRAEELISVIRKLI